MRSLKTYLVAALAFASLSATAQTTDQEGG